MWIPVHRMRVAAAQTCSPEQAPATYTGHQVAHTCAPRAPKATPQGRQVQTSWFHQDQGRLCVTELRVLQYLTW